MSDPESSLSQKTSEGDEEFSSADLSRAILKKARTSRQVSWLLDECIRIPGTEIRFGLDPILGLFPYGGETVATVVGSIIIGQAGQKGLPLRTLVRMGGNMLLNAGVGAIPVVGDLFSFWFKSNSRNYRMLNTYLESDDGKEHEGGWWPLLLIGSVIVVVILLNILSWVLLGGLVLQLWEFLTYPGAA
jgi:hypothetical protein